MRNDVKLTGGDIAALIIFVVAVITRAMVEFLSSIHPEVMSDYAWITTFAIIAASWLSLGSRVGMVWRKVEEVQQQTNGQSNDELGNKLDEIKQVIDPDSEPDLTKVRNV